MAAHIRKARSATAAILTEEDPSKRLNSKGEAAGSSSQRIAGMLSSEVVEAGDIGLPVCHNRCLPVCHNRCTHSRPCTDRIV